MELWREQYLLKHSEPQFVLDSLEKKRRTKIRIMDEDRTSLEEMLLDRNDPIIDLGLALYGSTPDVGYALFKKPEIELKLATLSGTQVLKAPLDNNGFAKRVLIDLIEENNYHLLNAYFSNDLLPDEILIALYERTEPFDKINDREWVLFCGDTSKNKRLSTPYNSTWMDGWHEYQYNQLFRSAWKLFETFPKTPLAATVLIELASNLVVETPYDSNVIEIISRWKKENDDDKDVYDTARSYGANMIQNFKPEFKELKNSDDLALRKAYYRNQTWIKPEDVIEGFEKDSIDYIDEALNNMNIFANAEARGALRKVCWDAPDPGSHMDQPNYFNVRSEYWQSKHPEWFQDEWTGNLPFEEIEDQEERREKRLEYLNTQVAELHKALLGDKDESQEANEFGENSMMNDLRLELQQIGEHLRNLSQKNSFSWSWIAFSVAIGFILGRY
jgi:hypothetical protein